VKSSSLTGICSTRSPRCDGREWRNPNLSNIAATETLLLHPIAPRPAMECRTGDIWRSFTPRRVKARWPRHQGNERRRAIYMSLGIPAERSPADLVQPAEARVRHSRCRVDPTALYGSPCTAASPNSRAASFLVPDRSTSFSPVHRPLFGRDGVALTTACRFHSTWPPNDSIIDECLMGGERADFRVTASAGSTYMSPDSVHGSVRRRPSAENGRGVQCRSISSGPEGSLGFTRIVAQGFQR